MNLFQISVTAIFGVVLAAIALLLSAPETGTTIVATSASTTPPAASSPVAIQATSSNPVVPTTPAPKPKKIEPAPVASVSGASSTPTQTNVPAEIITLSPQVLNDKVRAAVVNIICTTQTAGPFNSISASGVLIDSRGIILTNAHVGQYFLLKDYPTPNFVNCIVRTGSPAYPRYTAKLLYLPPEWIAENAQKINAEEPTGNGAHDYALLLITGTVSSSVPMPASFPSLAISTDIPDEKQGVFMAAYAAGFLGGINVSENLYESSAFANVGDLFTFDANTLDLFSVGGTILSQHGSSGGAVTDQNGVLLGLIVTATDAADTASRDLRAISTPYIIHDFITQTAGTPLPSYLAGDVAAEANTFNSVTAPSLTQTLVKAIEQH